MIWVDFFNRNYFVVVVVVVVSQKKNIFFCCCCLRLVVYLDVVPKGGGSRIYLYCGSFDNFIEFV